MSVSQENRKENIMHSIVKSMSLALYTIHICKNQNVFSPENDFNGTTTSRIVETAMGIYMDCFEANGINARKDTPMFEQNLQERIRLQKKAIQKCNDLYALAYIAQKQFR